MDRDELVERYKRDICPEWSVAEAIADAVIGGVPEHVAIESLMDLYLISFERGVPPGLHHRAKPWERQSRLMVAAHKARAAGLVGEEVAEWASR